MFAHASGRDGLNLTLLRRWNSQCASWAPREQPFRLSSPAGRTQPCRTPSHVPNSSCRSPSSLSTKVLYLTAIAAT